MPAPQRVATDAIKEALRKNLGNVTAAARAVGMSRNNLRKRLETSCTDVDTFRPAPGSFASVRVSKQALEALRQGSIDLAYVRRREHQVADVLEEFVAEALAPWLASKKDGS